MRQSNTFKRLGTGLVLTAFLVCCFLGTSMSLRPSYAWAEAPAPYLNDGKKVIPEDKYTTFEPGMTIREVFTIENKSTSDKKDVHYGFYFDGLNRYAKGLEVKILTLDGQTVAEGTMQSMNRGNAVPIKCNGVEDILAAGESKKLILQIHYPEESNNDAMLQSFEFDFCLVFSTDDVIPNTPENTEG